ncbi:hypothetical protein [Paenibacillus senegalimassiliensis]|uniref:hypothetical protein n=1 Tax=Paenibacillus senegalimassiliensis TaxID=1737426 RepID=UPI000B2ADD3B|nr:hypothetical protein [Paenibacillus senegalimassiliensis]
MLGKASEIKVVELKLPEVDEWLKNNSNVDILDIKYAITPADHSFTLIIYKEAKPHE